ncbi:MAG: hypothetical protein II098_01340 [Treponema sp.]|jgi:hypothetical protein|nr:hypothetical protein [Treponema sp.]
MNKDEIRKVAKHEVGHYLISRALNIFPKGISFTFLQYKDGYIEYQGMTETEFNKTFETLDDVYNYAHDKCLLSIAGSFAENFDESFNKIIIEKAKKEFEELQPQDQLITQEALHIILGCNSEIKKNSIFPALETLDKMYKEVTDYINNNYNLLIKLTNYVVENIEKNYGQNIYIPAKNLEIKVNTYPILEKKILN